MYKVWERKYETIGNCGVISGMQASDIQIKVENNK